MRSEQSDVFVEADTLPQHLVLYDGVCAVCDATVQWILDHDPAHRFHFAPLQGPTAAAILQQHADLPEGLDSIVLVQQTAQGEQVAIYSTAILRIAAGLPAPWSLARHLLWVPRPLRDLFYRSFAAVRFRIFGRVDSCRIPTESQVALFLD